MNLLTSALALVRSISTTSATGEFIPPQSDGTDPYGINSVNALTAAELDRNAR